MWTGLWREDEDIVEVVPVLTLSVLRLWTHRSLMFHKVSRRWLPGSAHAVACRAAGLYGQSPQSCWSSPGLGRPRTLLPRSLRAHTLEALQVLRGATPQFNAGCTQLRNYWLYPSAEADRKLSIAGRHVDQAPSRCVSTRWCHLSGVFRASHQNMLKGDQITAKVSPMLSIKLMASLEARMSSSRLGSSVSVPAEVSSCCCTSIVGALQCYAAFCKSAKTSTLLAGARAGNETTQENHRDPGNVEMVANDLKTSCSHFSRSA